MPPPRRKMEEPMDCSEAGDRVGNNHMADDTRLDSVGTTFWCMVALQQVLHAVGNCLTLSLTLSRGRICIAMAATMLIESQKGKDIHPTLDHFDTYGHTTATTVRMAKPFANSHSVGVLDGWFGGVKMCYGNKVVNKVDSVCTVKTNTALLPYKKLKLLCPKEHGAFITAVAYIDLSNDANDANGFRLTLTCIVICRGPRACVYLGTCGTTKLEVPASVAYTNKTLATAPYLVPNMVNIFTEGQAAVDLGNYYRQHVLAIEKAFVTKCFATRYTCTMSGINFVDTFWAHMIFNHPEAFHSKSYNFQEEMNKLAFSLLHNMVLAAESAAKHPHYGLGGGSSDRTSRQVPTGFEEGLFISMNGDPPSRGSPYKHVRIPLSQVPGYKGCKQQRCMLCDKLVSWVCARCTTSPHELVPMHPFSTKHQGQLTHHGCLKEHRKNPVATYKDIQQSVIGISKKSKHGRRTPTVYI